MYKKSYLLILQEHYYFIDIVNHFAWSDEIKIDTINNNEI